MTYLQHGIFWVYAHFKPKPIFSGTCYEVGTYGFIGERISINRKIVQTCFDRCPSDFLITLNACYCKDILFDPTEYHTCEPLSCFERDDRCGRPGTNTSEPCVCLYGKAHFSVVYGKHNINSDNCAVLKIVKLDGTFTFVRLHRECNDKLRVLCYESENVSRITSTAHLSTLIITKTPTTRVRTTIQPTSTSTAITEDNTVQSTLQNIESEVISVLPSVISDESAHEGTLETPSSSIAVDSQTTDKNKITVFLTSVTGLIIISVFATTIITLLLGGIIYIKRRKKKHQIGKPDETIATADLGYADVGVYEDPPVFPSTNGTGKRLHCLSLRHNGKGCHLD